jgi:phospholipase C
MAGQSRDNALDHVVVVVFENRSLDNVLGRLYGPGDGKTFDGVTGKDLTNPIPEWAEHGADRKVVPYTVATDMDSPNPDTGRNTRTPTPSCTASSPSRTGSSSARKSPRRTTPPSPARHRRWTASSPTTSAP